MLDGRDTIETDFGQVKPQQGPTWIQWLLHPLRDISLRLPLNIWRKGRENGEVAESLNSYCYPRPSRGPRSREVSYKDTSTSRRAEGGMHVANVDDSKTQKQMLRETLQTWTVILSEDSGKHE